jgi:CHAT domain
MLAMADERGRAPLVAGDELGTLLHDHQSLRLAVLNSCEGSRGDRSDPFSGTAQSLIQQGIPAVVAMQFEITDDAAIKFGHVLYEAIADGYPLDAATAEARKAIYAEGNLIEWGTPVLYLSAPDGRIFDIQDRPPPVLPPSSEEQARLEGEERTRQETQQQAQEAQVRGGDLAASLPGRIFISYRRQETAWPAGRLYDVLAEHFPPEQILKDVDNIDPGDDFVGRVMETVNLVMCCWR